MLEDYVERLTGDVRNQGGRAKRLGRTFQAIYLGGGTPTILPPKSLEKLLASLAEFLPLDTGAEITLEARFGTFDAGTIKMAADLGVNRLSIGVQSFDPGVMARVGRPEIGPDYRDLVAGLVRANPRTTVLDLIYGLPGQTPDIFLNDLKMAAETGAGGLALYPLKTPPGSALAKKVADGAAGPPPPLSELAGRYHRAALELLQSLGFRRVSASHWAAPDGKSDPNVYNSLSASRAAVAALGLGAGGHAAGASWLNATNLREYADKTSRGLDPVSQFRPAPAGHEPADVVSRQIALGLVDPGKFSPREQEILAPELKNWGERGLVGAGKNLIEPPGGEEGRGGVGPAPETDSCPSPGTKIDTALFLTEAGLFWSPNLEFVLRTKLLQAAMGGR
jgi:oxygen-independent coproporphyrinogen-3 oxidase